MTESSPEKTAVAEDDSQRDAGQRPRSLAKRCVRVLCLYALVPYLAITALFTLFQRRLIYHPTPSQPLIVAEAGFSVGAPRDVTLTTDDGLTLHGWFLTADSSGNSRGDKITPQTEAQAPLVLYFPGNALHRQGRVNDLRDFTALGCDVLIFDYRGYAENDGSPSEPALSADAKAIWRYATDELDVEPGQILLFGESLGGAVALALAESLCREKMPPAGLITNSTFASIPRLAAWHYPLFPLRWLVWDRWSSIDRISEVTCPVLMFHGTADDIVPIAEGRRLFAAAPECSHDGCDKTFVEIAGAGHNDIPVSRLQEHVTQLLSVVFPR